MLRILLISCLEIYVGVSSDEDMNLEDEEDVDEENSSHLVPKNNMNRDNKWRQRRF